MHDLTQKPNKLISASSPYLQQHAYNPVNWYPWGEEAFMKAASADMPIFVSIGYSTCHWCHVMAHECFEDPEVAKALNENFISIKVDKEERPDIDTIYMRVCHALTGSGGWPMSVFITPEQKPFFAGTYFPKAAFLRLLGQISELWQTNREEILLSGDKIAQACQDAGGGQEEVSSALLSKAEEQLKSSFDETNGGFGSAPKFPMPHNLLFLLDRFQHTNSPAALSMAEHTLMQMYKGGLYDHIGHGFSRYSTDPYFLAPHFEKMLYDNALLILAYTEAYAVTKKAVYRQIGEHTAEYILREMTSAQGGFYSAQDADSDGEEGKFYLFDYQEIIGLLGDENGRLFCDYYNVSPKGNFEGKNILNLLGTPVLTDSFDKYLPVLYQYRKSRMRLHLDDKILTAWNGLMIAAFAKLYKACKNAAYLDAAKGAYVCIEKNLANGNTLYASWRDGQRGSVGFLDDYAFYIFGLIGMYEAAWQTEYLNRALSLCQTAIENYYDREHGGFYLYGEKNEQLILKPKETYDGAMPSGNAVMAYNLVLLAQIMDDSELEKLAQQQLAFMAAAAQDYPMGHCFYLCAVSRYLNPPAHIVCAYDGGPLEFPPDAAVRIIPGGNQDYPLLNQKTTYYICKNQHCLPPSNDLSAIL